MQVSNNQGLRRRREHSILREIKKENGIKLRKDAKEFELQTKSIKNFIIKINKIQRKIKFSFENLYGFLIRCDKIYEYCIHENCFCHFFCLFVVFHSFKSFLIFHIISFNYCTPFYVRQEKEKKEKQNEVFKLVLINKNDQLMTMNI